MGPRIERQIPQLDHRISATGLPAQQSPNARSQLVKIERFDQVVIGARVEPLDPVGHSIARSQDQHRYPVTPLAYRCQYLETVLAGEAEIKQHEVVVFIFNGDLRGAAILYPVDCEAVLA